jgi:hypothetical protein
MKKLLVLALVLSLATMANAALTLQINVTGGVENPDGSYTLMPSDHLTIAISTPGGVLTDADQGDYLMLSDVGLGAISGGVIENSATWWVNTLFDGAVAAGAPVPAGMDGVWGSVGIFTGFTIPAGSVLFTLIDFHCEGEGDTVISIYTNDWNNIPGPEQLLDTVVIHQIPEPMTMALLGLGGLFLRRRK